MQGPPARVGVRRPQILERGAGAPARSSPRSARDVRDDRPGARQDRDVDQRSLAGPQSRPSGRPSIPHAAGPPADASRPRTLTTNLAAWCRLVFMLRQLASGGVWLASILGRGCDRSCSDVRRRLRLGIRHGRQGVFGAGRGTHRSYRVVRGRAGRVLRPHQAEPKFGHRERHSERRSAAAFDLAVVRSCHGRDLRRCVRAGSAQAHHAVATGRAFSGWALRSTPLLPNSSGYFGAPHRDNRMDGLRCVLLRASPALQAMQGKVIEVTRDTRGELQVRLAADRDLGR